LESLRADVAFKRTHFAMKIRRIPFERLVFLDESGLNLAMSRSHAWVKRGAEFIDRVPMNWGKNLNLLGAIRRDGWVVLTTTYEKVTKDFFVRWVKTKLLPKLRFGDVLVMDNLSAHHDPRVVEVCAERGVEVLYFAVLARLQPDRISVGAPEAIRSTTRTAGQRRASSRCPPRSARVTRYHCRK
jgi:transposase